MNPVRQFPAVDLGVAVLCCGLALPGLVNAWRHAPFDRLGWIALGLWVTPACLRALRSPRELRADNPALSWVALSLLAVGSLTDVNAVRYLAPAAAIGAFMPRQPATIAWLAASVAWMPVLGWLGAPIGPTGLAGLRVLAGAAGLGLGLLSLRPLTPPQP